ncbi:hypothetical protein D187_002424 [Cystobacter fuscus DSM 2262]|uniref:Uncharacterized protein n=1 Tax=Cystobacter fuscus (strain ATCC 25194 / DSM 2262 / NBRC 100088 / M29) TaxID=1242864 RepID=S9P5H2_CYSF2|nr:hypothetical protein D187_002424 [Cystobacter fuscus DSM 2262]
MTPPHRARPRDTPQGGDGRNVHPGIWGWDERTGGSPS